MEGKMPTSKDTKIAVVGVSENAEKFGHKIFKDLLANNFNVWAVGKGGKVYDKKIYPTLSDLPQKPELVIMVVNPIVSLKIVDECIALGIKKIHFQPNTQSPQAISKAKAAKIEVESENCFMKQEGLW
jgi:predicted CoA-binding protein